ncbi:MAG: MurR/RpiR family transcriptional regulator [Tissierellaceae bacterium]|nr:MurR/RpiR family transcriptional regulator [Tissierellaceae bacterium]
MDNIIKLIYKKYDDLTTSEKIIADYLVDNFNHIVYDTLNTLAQKIGVSTTSIIRFAKAMGFSGYSELQDSIRDYTKSDDPFNVVRNFKELEEENKDEFFENSLNKDIDNIKNTIKAISKTDLENAIDLLASSRNVYVIGYNDSFTLAYYMALRLSQVRESVHLLQPVGGMYPMEIASSNEEDVLIAYLYPRYSLNTINIINKARSNGTKVLIITAHDTIKIKHYSDVILPTYVHGLGVRESLVAPISLTDYLSSSVALVNPNKSKKLITYADRIYQTGYYLDNK